MNALADSIGIENPKRFRTKQLLWNEISTRREVTSTLSPSQRCYNQTDPCTLEPIDDISDLVEWSQTIRNKMYHFGASRTSLTRLLNNQDKPVILPWAIDFCSGMEAAENPEWYNKMFDIRGVISKTEESELLEEEQESPHINQFLFGIEELARDNTYLYGTLINRIVHANRQKIYERVSGSMLRVMYLLNDNPLQRDIFYSYCYVIYSSTSFHLKKKEDHLIYLLDILRTYAAIAGPTSQFVINLIFIDL